MGDNVYQNISSAGETGLAGTNSWRTAFEKRSPFYTTDWNQIPEVL